MSLKGWWMARVRLLERGNWYVRLTPSLGFGIPWTDDEGSRRRVRWARHHGLQIVIWRTDRWYVQKQVLGRSRVKGERYAAVRNA